MLIHCYAGISRSTAAAFIALCALNPHTSEELIASRLRLSSETACPNRLFVALADKMLGCDGRMIAAVAKMGGGILADEYSLFGMPAVHALGLDLPSGERRRWPMRQAPAPDNLRTRTRNPLSGLGRTRH